jgi:hypothetical protein
MALALAGCVFGLGLLEIGARIVISSRPSGTRDLGDLGLVEAFEPDAAPDDMRVFRSRGRNPEIEAGWTRTAEILASLADTIRARHARPVIIHVPARFEVSDRAFDLTMLRCGLDPEAWDPARLSEIAVFSGFSFLDLTPALRASASPWGGEPYFPVDGRWNRRGHDLAARALFSFLRDRSLLSCVRMGR